MKIKDTTKSYAALFLSGLLAGTICRLTDFLPYESLWSFSSMATMFGFWIASIGVITWLSSSNKGAFINSFLYMFGMTLSFYGLKYILGFYLPLFANESQFQTNLFIVYSALSVVCGIGSYVLFFWHKKNIFGSVLAALPASGMAAEAIGCIIILVSQQMLLAQTIFDLVFALLFGIGLYKKAGSKSVYIVTLIVVSILVFSVVYRPFLVTL